MSIIQSIELFTAINLAAIGVSHFFQPKSWVSFFQFLHAKKEVGNLFNAMLSLGMGSIIFSFHFIWSGPMILVTIYGLTLTLKGFIYFIFPTVGINSIGKVNMEKAHKFKIVGFIMMAFAFWIFYYLIIKR
ncbi:MAG: hypothetical protein AB8F94_13725 [Saprospiraceae bacterium]